MSTQRPRMNFWEFLDENGFGVFMVVIVIISELSNIIKAIKGS